MEKYRKEKLMKQIHIILIVLGSIYLGITVFHTNLWFDEAYTVGMVNHSFVDIWRIGSSDVHPILYYWILHFLMLLFGNSIVIYRLFSTFCFILLGILGYTHIRKDFNKETGLIFSFFVFFLPTTAFYASEIRMYGLGMLLGTLLVIYGYRIFKKKQTKFTLPIFAITSLSLAYTHYYGLILAGIVNVLLFIFLFLKRKERKKDFISFLVQAIIQVILYLPWLVCFVGQLKSVSQGFWISLSFPGTLFEVLTTQFKGNLTETIGLCLAIITYLYCGFLLLKTKKEEKKIPIWCFGIYFGIILLALVVSLTMGSVILLYRYLLIVSGLLFISFSYLLAKGKNNIIKLSFLFIILGFSIYNTVSLFQENYTSNESITYMLENIQEDDILIYSDVINGAVLTTQLYSKVNNISYFYNKDEWNVEKAYQAFDSMEIINDYEYLLKNVKGRIWVIEDGKDSLAMEMKDRFNMSLISTKSFHQEYKNLNFTITLIEKQS